MLAVVSGVAAIILSCPPLMKQILDYDERLGGDMVLYIPVVLSFSSAYIMRGLRLLVMYNPDSRQRWGALLRERNFLKIQLATFLAVEAAVWSCVLKFGINQ